jgi:hypothetical protein
MSLIVRKQALFQREVRQALRHVNLTPGCSPSSVQWARARDFLGRRHFYRIVSPTNYHETVQANA